jgi:hypothetical protein
VIVLAFAPLVGLWTYKVYWHPRPFWAHYYDPEAIYFYSGMEIVSRIVPSNVDNPGTPVQLLSAGIISFVGRDPFEFDRFRITGYWISGILSLGAAFLLARTILISLPLSLQVACLWSYFLSACSLEYATIWSPEALYYPVGVLALCLLVSACSRPTLASFLAAGLAVGLCCAVKFTFLAWVPALSLAFGVAGGPGWGKRLRCGIVGLAGVAMGFVLATAPVIHRYGKMLSWLWQMATRSGPYTSGVQEMPSLSLVLGNLRAAVLSAKLWHGFLLLTLVVVVAELIRLGRRGQLQRNWLALAAFAVTSIILSYALAARKLELRYLLPAGLSATFLLVVALRLYSARPPRWLQMALLVGTGFALCKGILLDVQCHALRIQECAASRRQIDETLDRLAKIKPAPIIVFSFRAPQPSLALRIMTGDARYHEAIGRRFPREGHLTWEGTADLTGTGADRWDFLVVEECRSHDLAIRLGPEIARAGDFVIYAPPAL